MTPEELQELHDKISDMRADALFNHDGAWSPEAEQLFLLALAALDTAQRYAGLAKFAQMQGR